VKLLKRDDFRVNIFQRDDFKCVYCSDIAVDAHHIIERKLFADGGYYIENGVSLCSKCHILAEQTLISCEELRRMAGINIVVLPEHFDPEYVYDKWGGIVFDDYRVKGELFNSEQVQKILPPEILNKFVMAKHVKYPRTPHLPWSEKLSNDDRMIESLTPFVGKDVVVTVKMDGENTTMYHDHIHARSLNSGHHPSRDWVKGLWGNFNYMLDEKDRICGENMFAKHTIHYKNLKTYFYVFSIWREETCLSWDDTVEMCQLLDLTTVPVLYRGTFDYDHIQSLYKKEHNGDPCEGYVLRLADEFKIDEFGKSIAKFVSSHFQILTSKHWMYGEIFKNELKNVDI
jgi:hypothetical protein